MCEKILSFCIGTYNRVNYLKRNIEALLSVESQEFEIIVVDNCSQDGTEEYLKSIQDTRLRFKVNTKNIGMAPNWKCTLDMAEGEFMFHLNDKDEILPGEIISLIQKLKKETAVLIWIPERQNQCSNMKFVDEECYFRFAYRCGHPTGYVFKKKIWNDIAQKEKEDIFLANNLYPYAFLITRYCIYGEASIYDLAIWQGMSIGEYAEEKSKFKADDFEDLWYHPLSRLKYYGMALRDCCLIRVNISLGKRLYNLFNHFLYLATIRYYNVNSNPQLVEHNGMSQETIKKIDLIKVSLKFLYVAVSSKEIGQLDFKSWVIYIVKVIQHTCRNFVYIYRL